jgi:hypothetical protein
MQRIQFTKTLIGRPEKWLIEAGAEIGLDLAGLTHEVTNHFKAHVIKRHGDPAKNGRATITDADFLLIPAVVKSPDIAIIGATRGEGLYIIYTKTDAGMTWLYFEQVLDSNRNKALRSGTFYKVTRELSLDEILKTVAMNDKTDVSKAKIFEAIKKVQTAGGRPGEEA